MQFCLLRAPLARGRLAILMATVHAALVVCPASAAILYESAMPGPTGITWQQVQDQVVSAGGVRVNAFNGVRFNITSPALVERVGAHLVGPTSNTGDDVFANIIKLDNQSDFPNSDDLSTSDVLGAVLLEAPPVSADVYGMLPIQLDPGWHALVIGSGRFGAQGSGAILRNNTDIGSPNYIGFLLGAGWGPRSSGMRFIVEGQLVPEPQAKLMMGVLAILCLSARIFIVKC